ncbi:MAG: serine/threonine protein kinase [Nodularia sp. (in: Bacteria)]|nr:MAG: serine/threonine protein kinase [Nodularia sp. (in: cyanobacteria)]
MTITLLNNRYQVIKVLGAGGFGETFLAEDTHIPSRRRCVIKQLKPIANDPKTYQMIQQRFEREAATLEYLGDSSDQIPKLFAYFSENELFYLVQEWIEGPTLTNIVEEKGYEKETTVREILVSLLSVLDYVHSKGIIHRDIKPDNIILRATDNKPFLIDFGAVKETIRSVVSSSNHPTRSLVIGTPGYMPTEQAIGRPVYATDIYSLGLTAIYLLTGKHPPELQTHLQTGEIIWQEFVPDISPHLAKVINQAIQPHVSDRYSTASKMLYDLKSASDASSLQSSITNATVSLSPAKAASTQGTQVISSLPTVSTSNWQKPALIIGSLVLGGLIGGVAISGITRQPQSQESITTSSTPTPSNTIDPTSSQESSPSPSPSEPDDTPAAVEPRLDTETPVRPQPQVTPTFVPDPYRSTPPPQPEAPESPPQPEAPESPPQPETPEPPPQPETPEPPPQPNQDAAPSNPRTSSVPAFPTGTSDKSVTAALGKPSKTSKGLWNTRAFLYNLEDNVDLGYLFDQKTGILRQTEVSFPQSIQLEVMQSTLQGMLGGNANSDINQGLQRVRDRQTRRYSFNVGGLKGVIERNQQDRIYIGVWDATLH